MRSHALALVLLARASARFDPFSAARKLAQSAVWLALAFAILTGARARAEGPANPGAVPATVMVVLASNQGSGSDQALAKLEALRKPPFDSFSKKTLLKRVALSLTLGKEVEVELPNGRKLRLSLLERAADGRYRVSVSINRPGKQDYLPVMTVAAAPGDPFFVAGQKHEGGTLIIGVSVGK